VPPFPNLPPVSFLYGQRGARQRQPDDGDDDAQFPGLT
jgi:hypothetical protein